MIGAVLHLWQRAVDRLGDALEGPEMGNLRVTLAALSARVAAAEGEAARLRQEREDWKQRAVDAAQRDLTHIAERNGACAEVERLRAELAGLRQTDADVRTWCEQAADAMDAAYAAGFRYGVDHPGEAFRDACDLGAYLDDQRLRTEWNHGRQDEAAARRLGEDTRAMLDAGVQGPSLTDPALVIARLLDERDAARGDREETWRQIDRVAKERDDLRRLVREVVKQVGNADGSPMHRCDKKCGRLATRTAPGDIVDLCDDCCDGSFCLGLEDATHAAAWRALIAALPTEAGRG